MKGHEYVIMLTQRCNFRCTYCYQTHAAVDQERAVVERIAASIRQHPRPGTRVVFHGGEPLLRKELMRHAVSLLLDEAGQPLCELSIVTNGSLIDDETIELFCRYGFEVNVSFDGCREAQAFRDAATFDRIVDTLAKLVPLHEAGRLQLKVAITLTLENLPYLSRSVAFLTDLGISTIQIEGELFAPWVEGSEREIERQVEQVTQLMERRVADGLPVPVSRLQPQPYGQSGPSWETDEERAAKIEARLERPECNCSVAGSSLVDADGTVWACPMFAPGLGQVDPGRLAAPDAFRHGSWKDSLGPSAEHVQADGERIRQEPIMAPKRRRYSRFAECETCPYVADCSACPASSHLPDVKKSAEEVPPLLCALNMAFLSRRHRIRRPVRLMDALLAVAGSSPRP